jgi:small conductance mechanosensitive channel
MENLTSLTAMTNSEDMSKYVDMAVHYGVQILLAIAIFIVGKWIAKRVKNLLEKGMMKAKVDDTLVQFLGNIAYGLMIAFVAIATLSQVGVQTASLAAILAAAGLAVGLALQGSLSNFASGVMLILFRPFKAGDFVEAGGTSGTVEEVSILTTIMKTPDNVRVIAPNSTIFSGVITNYSTNATRRVDLVVGVGYGDDLDKVKKTLEKVVSADKRVLKDPAVQIAVAELADSSVNLVVRPWVNAADYWGVKFDLTENIKKAFDKEGISIPFPQQDINVVVEDVAKLKAAE